MADLDVSSMSDDELMALAGGTQEPEVDATDETTDETVTTEAAQDAELPADQTDTTETERPEGWNPDGPGDRGVALKQERERNATLKAEAEQARAEAAELRQYRQNIEAQQQQYQQQQQAAMTREQLAEQLNWVDGTEAAAIVEQIRQHDQQTYQQQFQHQAQQQRLSMAAEMAREVYPDFDAQLQRAYEQFGPALDQIALQKNPNNPAKYAYELGKSLDNAANFDTRVSEAVAKALPKAIQAALQKQSAPANRGHETIGHVSSHSVAPTAPKSISQMSTEELERAAGIRK
jgi:chromosome segregation ATPase